LIVLTFSLSCRYHLLMDDEFTKKTK